MKKKTTNSDAIAKYVEILDEKVDVKNLIENYSQTFTALHDYDKKETNPKDVVGSKKVSLSRVSSVVLMEMSLGMLEGDRKYGGHNYRVAGVMASVYYDATMRHLMAWWEGEDTDKASGLSHISKALSSLAVLRDAVYNNKLNDDRPPKLEDGWIDELNKKAEEIVLKYPNRVKPFLESDKK